MSAEAAALVKPVLQCQLERFVEWLAQHGETSWDHQSYYAGPLGRRAKSLYYRYPKLGLLAVLPMVLSEALLPRARQLFHQRIRFPIADAHYAMGFGFMYEATGEGRYLDRAVHFLRELEISRSPHFREFAWGYPFDWVTRNGVMTAHTPLITSTPYMYEAFLHVHRLAPSERWLSVLHSIARHARRDFRDFPTSDRGSSCSYNPSDTGGVINAAAYRAFLLTSAGQEFGSADYLKVGERNLRFVLENQQSNGSWPYAVDGVRGFVDHFHTCFVMKALAKIHRLTGDPETLTALTRGVAFYRDRLFHGSGMPKPFAVAPRLTVYREELYDHAECINLCLLLRDRFPQLNLTLETVVNSVLAEWVRNDGAFRTRRLLVGWDNLPMHRWGQSQMFRSLAFALTQTRAGAFSVT